MSAKIVPVVEHSRVKTPFRDKCLEEIAKCLMRSMENFIKSSESRVYSLTI